MVDVDKQKEVLKRVMQSAYMSLPELNGILYLLRNFFA
jgi:hypothetical protein